MIDSCLLHHDDVFKAYTGKNLRPDADNRTFDLALLYYAALTNDGILDTAL